MRQTTRRFDDGVLLLHFALPSRYPSPLCFIFPIKYAENKQSSNFRLCSFALPLYFGHICHQSYFPQQFRRANCCVLGTFWERSHCQWLKINGRRGERPEIICNFIFCVNFSLLFVSLSLKLQSDTYLKCVMSEPSKLST